MSVELSQRRDVQITSDPTNGTGAAVFTEWGDR